LRQKGFAPERDQAFGVEVFRVQGPESHEGSLIELGREGELQHAD
jgi:hypothetical protein